MNKKKLFESEDLAKEFADKVNGSIRKSILPGYMSCEIVWVVEWVE